MESIELKASDMQIITPDQAWHYKIIPKEQKGNSMSFYIDESNFDLTIEEELEILFGKNINLEKISSELIQKTLGKYYRRNLEEEKLKNSTYSGKAEDFLPNLISEAKTLKSSDIHIEIYEEKSRVRFRIDGLLVERYILKAEDYPSLINQIKVSAHIDITEKRLPQDGRILFERKGSKFDIRVSVLPTLYGEKVVLRLLSNDSTKIDINALGFAQEDLDNYLEGIKKPIGIVLISGPTGSGKTTTLYATLKLLNSEKRNNTTIEDPVEYTLEGINQVQLKESIGFTFGRALKTFLRQDPDVIMVGEIRDADTATMAIRAAQTGHLVLSTIHTNSAWGTISRLIDMGIPAFLIADTLNTSVAQRLLRLLCPECKVKEAFSSSLYPKQFKPYKEIIHHFTPRGV
jgi:type IV pilus assembly protein PilB